MIIFSEIDRKNKNKTIAKDVSMKSYIYHSY